MSARDVNPKQQLEQLHDEIQSALDAGEHLPLQRWATVSYTPGRGRRLSACLWGSKREAEEGMDPDEVLVRVDVRIVRRYR